MDANQDQLANPFGMDESCRNCPELCGTRTQVVHGYGDVGADFLFVAERPSERADSVGVPAPTVETAADRGTTLHRILERLGLCAIDSDPTEPRLGNAYLTHLTRCRHPDRSPTDEEIGNCEPFLNAEVRMINPEIIVPIGQRALVEVGREYTARPTSDLELPEYHATSIRGRGFELVPMLDPVGQTDNQTQEWLEAFAVLMASDYRQTKGRRER